MKCVFDRDVTSFNDVALLSNTGLSNNIGNCWNPMKEMQFLESLLGFNVLFRIKKRIVHKCFLYIISKDLPLKIKDPDSDRKQSHRRPEK